MATATVDVATRGTRGDMMMAALDAPGNSQQLLTDDAVALALSLVTTTHRVPKEHVIAIVQAGLPAMARRAQEDPDLFSAIYAQSIKMQATSMSTFYARLTERPDAWFDLTEDHWSQYGSVVALVSQEASRQTGTSEEEAHRVMAAVMPAITHAMGKATDGAGEAGMMAWLKGIGNQQLRRG
jgi:hypothetical protein